MDKFSFLILLVLGGCILEKKDLCPDKWPIGDRSIDQSCRIRFCREEPEKYPECRDFLNDNDSSVTTGDAGGDGGEDADASAQACSKSLECPASAPICVDKKCVSCSSNRDCARRPATPVCDADTGACVACTDSDEGTCSGTSKPFCEIGGHECVACNEQADCAGNPSASACVNHECVPCTEGNDAQCSDVVGKNVCAAGTCVECTGTKAGACGDFVCDSKAHTCKEGVRPGDADLCEPCVSDAHCGKTAPSLCMPTTFDGKDMGYFCLPKRDPETGPPGVCIFDRRPYASTVNGGVGDPVPSIDGVAEPTCVLAGTTCQALKDYGAISCSDENDDDACGVGLASDGICAPVPATTIFLCSVPCRGPADCNPGTSCTGSNYCSL